MIFGAFILGVMLVIVFMLITGAWHYYSYATLNIQILTYERDEARYEHDIAECYYKDQMAQWALPVPDKSPDINSEVTE